MKKTILVYGLISGAIAAVLMFGTVTLANKTSEHSEIVGYAGIIVAILARLQPLGVVPAAILFGGLANGALYMQIRTGVPSALAYAIQAIVLLALLAASALARYRLVRRHG